MTSSHIIILFACTCTIFLPLNVHTDVPLVTRPGQVVDSVVDSPPDPADRNDGMNEADGTDGGGDDGGGGVGLGKETAGVQITEKGGDKITNFKPAMYDVGAYGRIVDDGDGKLVLFISSIFCEGALLLKICELYGIYLLDQFTGYISMI